MHNEETPSSSIQAFKPKRLTENAATIFAGCPTDRVSTANEQRVTSVCQLPPRGSGSQSHEKNVAKKA